MKVVRIPWATMLALLLSGAPLAASADQPGTLSIGAQGGTSGFGFTVGTSLGNDFATRVQTGHLSVSGSRTTSNTTYQGNVVMNSISVLLDYHPGGGAFRITPGMFVPNINGNGTAQATGGTITLNGTTYPAAALGTVSATVRYPLAAPYIGIGVGPSPRRHNILSFSFDAGAAFLTAPQVTMSANGPLASDPTVQANLEAERQSLRTQINNALHVYPVISLGLQYKTR